MIGRIQGPAAVRYRPGMAEKIDLIEDFTQAVAARDVDRAVELYAPDAVVVRYEGIAAGADEIKAFILGLLSTYERFDAVSVDQVQRADDVIVWDASYETGAGVLQTTNVFVVDDDGRIVRHVPLVRGYWGRT